MLDVLIENAWVVDGTGNPGFRAHVGIREGRIVLLRRSVPVPEAARVIDAEGLVCAPGFIDLHTHSDYSILIHHHALSSLRAGVTTEAMGMCGYGVFPADEHLAEEARARIAGLSQVDQEAVGEVDWFSLDDWLSKLERRGVGINVAQFVGHGALRAHAMGPEGSGGEEIEPTPEQMEKMKRALREAMEQGAFGLSSGLQYPPGRNATTQELVELGQVVAEFGGSYISHLRSEGELLIWAARELITICRRSGMRGSMSHHKALGEEHWGKVRATTALIDEARAEGIQVMCDFYPWEYAAESNIGSVFYTDFETTPRDAEELMRKLRDPQEWRKLKRQLEAVQAEQLRAQRARAEALAKRGVRCPSGGDRLESTFIVHSASHPEIIGMNAREAARHLGFGDDYLEAARQLYLDDDGYCYVAGGRMWEEDIRHLVTYPYAAISTDSWTMERFPNLRRPGISAHPRNYGSYAKILGQYCRDEGLLRLEEAVRKMTSLPASLLGLKDRGLVAEGYWADLCLFDPRTVRNEATYAEPCRWPVGIKYVLVNGAIAIDDGQETRSLSGQVLRFRG